MTVAAVQGEEVQSVSSKSKDAEGVSGLPEPEENAAEDAEGVPALPSPAVPKDPFPLKDSIIIDLEALPQVCGGCTSARQDASADAPRSCWKLSQLKSPAAYAQTVR